MAKKKKTALPRVTLLAYSRMELLRFSEAAEQVVGLAHMMVGLMTRLDACVTRLEQRTAAAHKANATRKAPAAVKQPEDGGHVVVMLDPPMEFRAEGAPDDNG